MEQAEDALEKIIGATTENSNATSIGHEKIGTTRPKKAGTDQPSDALSQDFAVTMEMMNVLVPTNVLNNQHRPTMILPFVPCIGDKLRKIAADF